MESVSLLLLLSWLLLLAVSNNPNSSHATHDIINSTQILKDGDTISSSGGRFELGFFKLGSPFKQYVGIRYKQIPAKTVVWVANRNVPIIANASQVVLKVTKPGILLVLNINNAAILWSTNMPAGRAVQNPVAQLLDSGNLVVRDAADENPDNFLWQSFDYPAQTYLPGVRMGKNLVTGKEVYMTAWRSDDDPSSGEITMHCDPSGYPQTVIRNGSTVIYRTGPWNGLRWSGIPFLSRNPIYTYDLVMDQDGMWIAYQLLKNSVYIHLTLTPTGVLQREMWVEEAGKWYPRPGPMIETLVVPLDVCDSYGICGPNGVCNIDESVTCSCLDKFLAKYQGPWDMGNWLEGCVRRTPLNCSEGTDVFVEYSGIKLPDTRKSWFNRTMTLGEFFYGVSSNSNVKRRNILIGSLSSAFGLTLLALGLGFYMWKMKRKEKEEMKSKQDFELPLFNLSTITRGTNNFSSNNKIGEGGFGPVYKGVLEDGMEIAVKRLSKTSMQGLEEFKNEIIYIAKLQHRNFVKLLGCCIQGEEMMLVYEYMTNKSLDAFIFGLF
nr:G-type lectin S-receptor-like serine/threonine-protein kinase At4g27290 isoform X2 [Ipomoea batatas]